AALRPGPWPVATYDISAAGQRRARPPPKHASYRLGCVVQWYISSRTDHAVQRLCGRETLASARIALAVRRLRCLAASVVAGRGAREPGALLDEAAGWSRASGTAHRPSAPSYAESAWSAPQVPVACL